jgi:hypothetical protein
MFRLFGTTRALEVTSGPHGFHPHLHILLLAETLHETALEKARESLSVRWQSVVARTLGPDHAPNDRVGCDLRACANADYLSKLGLELTGPASKAGRVQNLTPFQVAERFVEAGDESDLATWLSYCQGIRGARMLTWSRGLRDAAGLGVEKSDEAVVAEEETAVAEVICAISGRVWDSVRDVPGANIRLIMAAESRGAAGIEECLARLLSEDTVPPH